MPFPRDGSDVLILVASWLGVAVLLGLFMFGYAIVAVVATLSGCGAWVLWRRYRGASMADPNNSLKSDNT
ncbi:MAG: hypothetical protein AMXMBFR81_19500 [Chthonomonas sp.]|nr:hypothetical protein [Fimbriimonadaceae bacterium]